MNKLVLSAVVLSLMSSTALMSSSSSAFADSVDVNLESTWHDRRADRELGVNLLADADETGRLNLNLESTWVDGRGRDKTFSINSDEGYSYGKNFRNYRVAKGVRDAAKLYKKNEARLTGLYGEAEYKRGLNKLGQWYGNVKYSKRAIDASPWVKEDTAIRNAWSQGYDGRGVNVDVYDWFADEDKVYSSFSPNHSRAKQRFQGGVEVMSVGKSSHGEHVTRILGGKSKLKVKITKNEYQNKQHKTRTALDIHGNTHTSTYVEWDMLSDNKQVTYGELKYVGIAPEANIRRKDRREFGTTLHADFSNTDIINLSLGADRAHFNSNHYFNNARINLNRNRDSSQGTLIVKAAGNTGGNKASTGIWNNTILKSKYKDSTLLVGAIAKVNERQMVWVPSTHPRRRGYMNHVNVKVDKITDYSSVAGEYKNNFVVDYGSNLGELAHGTSLAAPRVAGKAAIIKSKFRNITATQLANVIKETADDLGAPGVDDIYGHGKVNLRRALSPIGNIN